MKKQMDGQDSMFGADGASGRTYVELSAATTDVTFSPFWKNLFISQTQKLQFLDLRKSKETSNGKNQELLLETNIPLRGVSTMHNTSAFLRDVDEYVYLQTSLGTQRPICSWNISEMPNQPIESKLSWILEENADTKYNLSPTACSGILRRAAKRGKELPEMLKKALEKMAGI